MIDFRRRTVRLGGVLLWAALVPLRGAAADFRPFEEGETLIYRLLWPSGITLGEAVFQVSPRGAELHFQVTVTARLPQHRASYTFSSVATREGLCSLQFHQKTEEGTRRLDESIQFDQAAHQARRISGGPTATAPIPECARDPLTFFYYVRSQLAAGTPPESGATHFGRTFDVRLGRAGSEALNLGGSSRPAEKFELSFPAGNAERTVEIWFAPDAARTPLRFVVPTSLADFSANLE